MQAEFRAPTEAFKILKDRYESQGRRFVFTEQQVYRAAKTCAIEMRDDSIRDSILDHAGKPFWSPQVRRTRRTEASVNLRSAGNQIDTGDSPSVMSVAKRQKVREQRRGGNDADDDRRRAMK